MDRNKTSLPKMQQTFIEFVVLPTVQACEFFFGFHNVIKALCSSFSDLNFLVEHGKSNLSVWKSFVSSTASTPATGHRV